MNPIAIAALILGLLLVGLVVWVLLRLVGDQKDNEALESQMSELRRDLLNLSATQAQSTTKLETIAGNVATRLEAVTTALKDGVKDSAQITSKLTSESQAAMSLELKNTREQINQIQNQLGEVQQAGQQMFQTAPEKYPRADQSDPEPTRRSPASRPADVPDRANARKYFGRREIPRLTRRNHPGTPSRRFPGALAIRPAIPLPQR